MPQPCPTKVRLGYFASAGSPVGQGNEPNGTLFLLVSIAEPNQHRHLFLRQFWTRTRNDVEQRMICM